MLRAFARVRRGHPNVRLLVATGDGAGFERYRGLAAELGVIEHLVVRDTPFSDLPGVLAEASIALNPREVCDGMPMKVLNYMAAGVPIVSFAGSAKGLEHERTALVVADGDVDAFAAAIARLVDEPRWATKMGADARARLRVGRTWDTVAERLESVYRRLLESGGGLTGSPNVSSAPPMPGDSAQARPARRPDGSSSGA